MTGKSRNIGFRPVVCPEVRYTAAIPPTATSMTTGSRRVNGLTGGAPGRSGGRRNSTTPEGGGFTGSTWSSTHQEAARFHRILVRRHSPESA